MIMKKFQKQLLKGVYKRENLKNFAKFTREQLFCSPFLNKVAGYRL